LQLISAQPLGRDIVNGEQSDGKKTKSLEDLFHDT
jgi:hypothetical protein